MKKNTTRKGFSIGEVLLSMFVLVVGIIGVMQLSTQNITVLGQGRDIVIATQLAQEGLELVRNVRDNNAAQGEIDVFLGMDDGQECAIDFEDPLECLVSDSSFELNLQDDFFTHAAAGSQTKFNRKVIFSRSTPPDAEEINDITVFVWWIDEPTTISDCTTRNGCVWAETTLTTWILGE